MSVVTTQQVLVNLWKRRAVQGHGVGARDLAESMRAPMVSVRRLLARLKRDGLVAASERTGKHRAGHGGSTWYITTKGCDEAARIGGA